MQNNIVEVTGKVMTIPVVDHEVKGESFYKFDLQVLRNSGVADIIPVTISERIIRHIQLFSFIRVNGQIRSYNQPNRNGVTITLFALKLDFIQEIQNSSEYINNIYLNGSLCKKPIFRTTPFGREICDIVTAVNRNYNKSDYIHCVAWGRNARYLADFNVGDNLMIDGRFQSREYKKILNSGEETRIAYEVSICNLNTN